LKEEGDPVSDGDEEGQEAEGLSPPSGSEGEVIPLPLAPLIGGLAVPANGGPHAGGLLAILRRIPEGWVPQIGCDRGWYPLILALDEELSALDPGYTVLQVKQKFGELRYYFETTRNDVADEMKRLTEEFKEASRRICERCGGPGGPMHRGMRVRTLCDACGHDGGFEPAKSGEEDRA
jgi:hypothetical protein